MGGEHINFKFLKKRRYKAAELFEKGKSQAEVARELGVSRQSASRWFQEWEQGGKKSLRGAGRAGRIPKLNRKQLRKVAEELTKGARVHGFTTELWTLPRIARVIEVVAGVTYHPGHVWRVMRKLGWTLQKPTTRARERNEEKVTQWKTQTWAEVKKKRNAPVHG